MHLIVYISEYCGDASAVDADIADIVRLAQEENPKHEITGVLFYHEGRFIQIIEGEEAELRSLMSNIEKDSRHRDVKYLIDEKVLKRGFSSWNMDTFNLSNDKNLDYEKLKEVGELCRSQFQMKSSTLVDFYKVLLKAE